MNEKLRAQVEHLFAGAPNTRRAQELKEELLVNLNEKLGDLMARGASEEEALRQVMGGIGDIEELLRGLKEADVMDYAEQQKQRKKTAVVVTSFIGITCFAVLLMVVGVAALRFNPVVMTMIMLAIIIGAVCMLVYHFLSRPRYVKADDTLVEEFKQWKSVSGRNESIRKTISSVLWLVTVALYFLISFNRSGWGYTWIVFLIAAALEHIIKLVFQLKEGPRE